MHTCWGLIPIEIQHQPSIPKVEVLDVEVEEANLWITPIQEYIVDGTLSGNNDEDRKLRYKGAQYVIYDGILYKRGFNRSLLKCVAGIMCEYIMREVHEGICGNHSGVASIAHQILRQGYHWPTFYKDARAFAKSCDNCQRFSNTNKITTVPLKTLTSPWPIIVWAEAEPLASITARNLVEFVYQAIVCPYGVPYKLISDNGK